MPSFLDSHIFHTLSAVIIGGVWVFHGLYSKLLDGIPRHRLIVGRILGERIAGPATKVIGLFEIALGIWVFTGWKPIGCAAVQTLAIVGMNTVEILLAGDLLISATGMLILNFGFLLLVWHWALAASTI
ncbi:MAG: DoxX-like family protein [Chthoniobacteraceae bacterium]